MGVSGNVKDLKTKFYISLTFSLVFPPCKLAPPGALVRRPQSVSLSQTTKLYVWTNMPEGRLDHTDHSDLAPS